MKQKALMNMKYMSIMKGELNPFSVAPLPARRAKELFKVRSAAVPLIS